LQGIVCIDKTTMHSGFSLKCGVLGMVRDSKEFRRAPPDGCQSIFNYFSVVNKHPHSGGRFCAQK